MWSFTIIRLGIASLLLLVICAMGWGAHRIATTPVPPPSRAEWIIDTSASTRSGGDLASFVADLATTWLRDAVEGSSLRASGFSLAPGAAATEDVPLLDYVVPAAVPPVHVWMRRETQRLREQVRRGLAPARLPQSNWSPIVESTWQAFYRCDLERTGGGCGRAEVVLIATDLLETTPEYTWDRAWLARHSDEQIVRGVLSRYPRPKCPPDAVTVYYRAGRAGTREASGGEQTRLKELFKKLFAAWGVRATPVFKLLK